MTDESKIPRLRAYASLSDEVGSMTRSPEANSLVAAFEDMIRLLRDMRVGYAVIGAFAVSAYVTERRSTRDIDVVVEKGNGERLRKHAPDYGFRETSAHGGPGGGILRFRHDGGAMLDVILNPTGFAELDKVNMFDWPELGKVAVASAEDVAWSKLCTQDEYGNRFPEKRAVDRGDLIAILRNNPHLANVLWKRFEEAKGLTFSKNTKSPLAAICREASIPPPGGSPILDNWILVSLAIVVGMGVILLVIALSIWLLNLT